MGHSISQPKPPRIKLPSFKLPKINTDALRDGIQYTIIHLFVPTLGDVLYPSNPLRRERAERLARDILQLEKLFNIERDKLDKLSLGDEGALLRLQSQMLSARGLSTASEIVTEFPEVLARGAVQDWRKLTEEPLYESEVIGHRQMVKLRLAIADLCQERFELQILYDRLTLIHQWMVYLGAANTDNNNNNNNASTTAEEAQQDKFDEILDTVVASDMYAWVPQSALKTWTQRDQYRECWTKEDPVVSIPEPGSLQPPLRLPITGGKDVRVSAGALAAFSSQDADSTTGSGLLTTSTWSPDEIHDLTTSISLVPMPSPLYASPLGNYTGLGTLTTVAFTA